MPTLRKLWKLAGFSLLVLSGISLTIVDEFHAGDSAPAIDLDKARRCFAETKARSDRDHGALWHVTLAGPILLVDRETRFAVASQSDAEGNLKARDGVFVGTVPPELGFANTATTWGGVKWTMVMWPLPVYEQARQRLVLHECFHRIQDGIGLPMSDTQNGHLDALSGRIWLELEWRALEHAYWQQGPDRRRDVADAVYFRAYRRSLFPGAAASENALEMNEGLAEYTGVKLSSASPQEYAVIASSILRSAPTRTPSFGRSFAYTSGPAYGGLLDAAGITWRPGLSRKADFGDLASRAYHVEKVELTEAEAIRRASRYGGNEVIAVENEREARHQARLDEARKRFVDGPVLVLPAGQGFGFTFDPDAVLSLDDAMTLYGGSIQVTDLWGILKTTEGALFVRDHGKIVRVQIPAPSDAQARPIAGPGWSLDLKPGFGLAGGARPGDYVLRADAKSSDG